LLIDPFDIVNEHHEWEVHNVFPMHLTEEDEGHDDPFFLIEILKYDEKLN
jgi:hypothetical protein